MNDTNQMIPPKNMFMNIDKNLFEANFQREKKDSRLEKENKQCYLKNNESTEDKEIIAKINKMVFSWICKYRFHTKSIKTGHQSDVKNFVTEFSNPSSENPIPKTTSKVN